jgi:phage gpG-like protein
MKLNKANLNASIHVAFYATVQGFAETCKDQISDPIWDWPRGESPRDIVDTGELRDSMVVNFTDDNNTALIEWTADHAAKVHEGDYSGKFVMPGRPWTHTARREFDIAEEFKNALREEL